MVAPRETQYVRCLDEKKGQYRFASNALFQELPQWKWAAVLTLSNA